MKFSIRLLYLYLFSFIGLLIAVIGTVQLVDLSIKVYVFNGADRYESYPYPAKINPDGSTPVADYAEIENQRLIQEKETNRQRQRQTSTAIAMIIVGLPLYKYHWGLIKE